MNIAILSDSLPYLPSPGGFRLYGGNLIRCMARRHRIDLISLLRDDDENHLDWAKQYCRSVTAIPSPRNGLARRTASLISSTVYGRPLHCRAEVSEALRAGLKSRKWDVLHIEGTFVGALVPAQLHIPKIISVHDSWTLRCQEMLKCSSALRERLYYRFLGYHELRFERLVYPRFGRCVVVAERDRKEVSTVVSNARVEVVPYGTDVNHYRPLPVDKEAATLVFHGHLGYPPNIDAAMEFADTILPLIRASVPDAKFRLIAANPVKQIRALAHRPGIEIIESPADVRPPICSSTIYVCAIRHGTGMKTKMLEAMAMRMPIVCYPGSAAGIECSPGKHLLMAHSPEEFASQVVQLLRNPSLADALAGAGHELAQRRYSWEGRAEMFERLYAQVIEERRSA